MFLLGIGDTIPYIGVRGDQFCITTIGIITTITTEVIAFTGHLIFVILPIILIT